MTAPTEPDIAYFAEAFLTPGKRGQATHELAAYGATAIPILRGILNGEACNQFNVPYRNLGMPIDCALVTVQLLGTIAKPLELLVREQLAAAHPYAEAALNAITS